MQLPDGVDIANPVILALDAAGAACSAALWRDGGIRGRRFEAMSRGQSERLVPMIQETLGEAYVDKIRGLIRSNRLAPFDRAQLVPKTGAQIATVR